MDTPASSAQFSLSEDVKVNPFVPLSEFEEIQLDVEDIFSIYTARIVIIMDIMTSKRNGDVLQCIRQRSRSAAD